MRLSEWRAAAPARDAMTARVLAVIEPVVESMGADRDPHCWVGWGDDPSVRYPVFVPVPSGLIVCSVRVNVPGEGPRASAKLVRWPRVQLGELLVETQAGHRVATFQIEQQVLRAVDAAADRISSFALTVMAAIDGRPLPETAESRGRRPAPAKAASKKAAPPAGAKPRRAAPAASTSALATRGRPGANGTAALGPGTSTSIVTGSPKQA